MKVLFAVVLLLQMSVTTANVEITDETAGEKLEVEEKPTISEPKEEEAGEQP